MSVLINKILRTKFAAELVGFMFAKADKIIPVKRLRETDSWLAIIHPKPCYPVHIVILPKRKISNWLSLPVDDAPLYSEFVDITQGMIRDFCLEEAGYRLIVNGGVNQTFPHLHVHLVAGDAL